MGAVNDGIGPPRSNDAVNPRWGTWPQQGTQWVQLEWPAPVEDSRVAVTWDALDPERYAASGTFTSPATWQAARSRPRRW